MPINSAEKIDKLIEALKGIPGAMNPNNRNYIFQNIGKAKLQIYFNDKYPESIFTEDSVSLPEISSSVSVGKSSIETKEEEQPIPVPKETLGSKKYIYGTYIEMAFHNLFLNIEHIYAIVTGKSIMEEAKAKFIPKGKHPFFDGDFANESLVWKPMFNTFRNSNSEDTLKIEEMLNRHFPFLVPFRDYIQQSKYYNKLTSVDILERLSQTLRVLRNVYAHYKITLYDNQRNVYLQNEKLIFECLDRCFLGARRIVKERFAFDDRAMHCTEQYEFHIDKSKRDERNRPIKIKKEIPGFRYKLYTANQAEKHITSFGLVFLTSLFLEKKYSKVMSDKLRVVAKQDESVVCEMLAVYRLRLNSQRINVTKKTEALALDIINEVQRCPKELFDILPPSKQAMFRVKSDTEDEHEVLMIRHSNRFAQLVMKYIDDAHLFDNLRFQVSLGRYFYKFYDKKCIDSHENTRVRAICKNVNGFGRIEEIEKMRQGCWDDVLRQYEDVHKNTSDEKPYVTDHHAQYIITGNRIGMRFMDDAVKCYLPELTTDGVRNLPPTCWMSTYELPALMFLLHLTDDATRIEDIIRSTVNNYTRFFNDIELGKLLPTDDVATLEATLNKDYGISSLKDIPQNMVDYLLGHNTEARDKFVESANATLDRLIAQTEYKISKYKDEKKLLGVNHKENKIGKKSYVQSKPGALAFFLAKDIMFFQPNDEQGRNKLTGLNFRILQAVLATFKNGETDELKRTLESAHIIGKRDDDMCNPIVQRLWSDSVHPSCTQDFYEMYLIERLSYLKECKRRGNLERLSFLYPNRMKWQIHDEEFSRSQAGRYLHDSYGNVKCDKAIELPRGLFEKHIREELKSIPLMKALAEDTSKNISYLIYGYFMKVMNDDCQNFYEAERSYQLFNVLYKKSPRDSKQYRTTDDIRLMLNRKHTTSIHKDIKQYLERLNPKNYKKESEKIQGLLRRLKDNETILKTYKVQDMLLLLIAKKIFMSNVDDPVQAAAFEQIRLRDIQNGETLTHKIKMCVRVCSKNGYGKVIKKDDLMLKHYANFYHILSDRRLPTLLDLVRGSVVEHSYIESELSGYDKVRPGILEEVFGYEKEYYQQNPDAEATDFGYIVNQSADLSQEKRNSLRNIRNSFAHNTYPKYKDVQIAGEIELPKKAIAISEKFKNDIKK